MADAHVPNAKATPGWKDHPFPRTNFLNAIETTPVEGFDGCRYAGQVPIDWCSGAGSKGRLPALGGYLCGAMISACRQFSRSKFPERTEHDPLSIYVEFLQTVPQGPYHVLLKVIQSGTTQSTISAEIVSADPSQGQAYCFSILRMGSLKGSKGDKSMQIERRIPDRLKDCGRWVDPFFYYVNPPSSTVRGYTPNGGPNRLWSPEFGGQNARYQWNKLDNGETYELEHLALIVDLIPPLPLNYEKAGLKAIVKYQMPTMSMSMSFRSDVRDHEWLLVQTNMRWVHNGRFEESIEIMDENGTIVATCHQLCSMFPAKRPNAAPASSKENL